MSRNNKNSFSSSQNIQNPEEIPDLSLFDQSPNSIFFDLILQKTLKMKLFYKWKTLFYIRRNHGSQYFSQSNDQFGNSNEYSDFDESLVLSSPEKDSEALQYIYHYSRIKNKKYLISKYRVKKTYFQQWISKFFEQKRTERIENQCKYGNITQGEIFGQLHSMIEKNSKMETDLETLEGKIDDLNLVLDEAEEKINKKKERYNNALDEQKRQDDIKNETISKYEDIIASLKMQITVSKDKREEKLNELKNRLRLAKQAKGLQYETNDESMENINSKIRKIKDELQRQKEIALQARAGCLSNKKQCDDISKEIAEYSEKREDMAAEVDRLEIQIEKIANGSLEDLRKQKESADNQLMDMRSKIQRNEGIRDKLAERIQTLIIERNAARKMLESAERAFSADIDDEEEEDN